jgi:hypothetical protein
VTTSGDPPVSSPSCARLYVLNSTRPVDWNSRMSFASPFML